MISKENLINKGLKLIPVNRLTIQKEELKSTGYDFTVEDYFTFKTHDGVYIQDCMAIYFPITIESTEDIKSRIGVWKNLINPTDMTLVPTANQDIILGLWACTKEEDGTHEFKGSKLSSGRLLFNKCLPDDYPIQNKRFGKKELTFLLNDIGFKYSPKVVIKTVDNLKQLGFMMTTMIGYTLSIDDLYDEELVGIAHNLTGDMNENLKVIHSKEVKEKLLNLPFADFILSGARGKWDQVKQLVMCRGYVASADGTIVDDVIKHSLVEGLTPDDFCKSSWGTRKGLLDTAMSAGDSGYLSRQLIYSNSHEILDYNCDDCETTDGLKVFVRDESFAKVILYRYYIDDECNIHKITLNNYKSLIGKTIILRSPIYCKNPKICKRCYGDIWKILHSDEIGFIASNAISERSLQLVLRTFHTGGVASYKEGSSGNKNEDIIVGLHLANKIFHSAAFILGEENKYKPEKLIDRLYDLFNPTKAIHTVHYEVLVSSMMMVGENQWRLLENRSEILWTWMSILKIPSQTSWLLGAAFSNLKGKLIDGLVSQKKDVPNSLTSLFSFKDPDKSEDQSEEINGL